jgi:hypothetical protein
VNALLPRLRFGDGFEANVFHAAFSSDRVIYIEQPHVPGFASKLPVWWTSALSDARSFVILPLSSHGSPAGFLYGDWTAQNEPPELGPVEFGLLNDLRGLLARSLEQRHQFDVAGSRA